MNTHELQQLKMAWLAAKEVGDTGAQITLLQAHPETQAALIDFIAAYAATNGAEEIANAPLLPFTLRASQAALQRVFDQKLVASNLAELRSRRGLSMINAARGLRLSVDVWKKFESGAIELISLSDRQLERLAGFFQVTTEQFGLMLTNSQPSLTINRRQTETAARSKQQSLKKQSFAEAIEKSTMKAQEKRFWLEQ
ncbi:MAG: helix-turn-helix transcriptional regulator [Chloroflexota bacterium]|nr:helix-turn-helix transcriptional regulator [Chloroflexota bacterium]